MPSGYTLKRRVGQAYNNSSGDLTKFLAVNGVASERHVVYDAERTTTLRVLNAGTQTAWTDISCSTLVPPNATSAIFLLSSSTSGAGFVRPNGSVNSTGLFIRTSTDYNTVELPMLGDQTIEYQAASSMNLTVDCIGYRYQCDVPVSTNAPESPAEWIQGLQLSWDSVSQVVIGAGRARLDCNCMDMVVTGTRNVSLSSSGAGGRDTGSEASDKVYYIWLIYNPTTVTYSGLASLSGVAPLMPSGYTVKRLVGAVYNNASSNILKFFMVGVTKNRFVFYDESRSGELRVLSGGTSGSWADVDSSDLVPLGATEAYLMCQVTSGTSGSVRPDDLSDHDGYLVPADKSKAVFVCGQRFFEYIVVGLGASLTVDLMGYRMVL
jgi:hypothetical protein